MTRRPLFLALTFTIFTALAAPGASLAQAPAQITDTRSPGGIRIINFQIETEKRQYLGLYWRSNLLAGSVERSALGMFANDVMRSATIAGKSAGELEEEWRELEAVLLFSASGDWTMSTLMAPVDKFARASALFREKTVAPVLSRRALERSLANLDRIASGLNAMPPDLLSSMVLQHSLLEKHPAIDILRAMENPAAVRNVTLDTIEDWRKQALARDNLVIVSAGPVPLSEIAVIADEIAAGLPAQSKASPPPAVERRSSAKTVVLRRPVEQAQILAGQIITWPESVVPDEQIIAIRALGGNNMSRLYAALRERLSATYSVEASVEPAPGVGNVKFIKIKTAVAADKLAQSLKMLRDEYAAFVQNGVREDEIEKFQRTNIGSQASPKMSGIMGILMGSTIRMGAPVDSMSRRKEAIAAVTRQRVNDMIRAHMPAQLSVVIVAPSAEGLNANCVIDRMEELKACLDNLN